MSRVVGLKKLTYSHNAGTNTEVAAKEGFQETITDLKTSLTVSRNLSATVEEVAGSRLVS